MKMPWKSQGYSLLSGHVRLWALDHKEGTEPKNWWLQTIVLEKTDRPLDSKEIKPVNHKGNQPWILIGKNDTEVEIPVFWSPDVKSRIFGKVPDAGKDWGQKKNRVSEGWDGWMPSAMQRTWTWANCGRWWAMGRPGVLQYMVSLRVGYNRMTEQKQHNPPTREFSSIQLLSHVQLFVNPCTAAHQASLSIINSWSLHKLMPMELVMASNIISSVIPFSSCLQSFPALGSFQMSPFCLSGGQSIGVSASASVLPMNIQDWFPLGWAGWISCSPRYSQESSPAPQFKSIKSLALSFLYSPTLTYIHEYWKNNSFD